MLEQGKEQTYETYYLEKEEKTYENLCDYVEDYRAYQRDMYYYQEEY